MDNVGQVERTSKMKERTGSERSKIIFIDTVRLQHMIKYIVLIVFWHYCLRC